MLQFDELFQEKQPHNKFKFKCVKGCDLCCKMNEIALYPFDIMKLCGHLNLATKGFHEKYTRFVFDPEAKILRCFLITIPRCLFFDAKEACTAYDARPARCRLFPVARFFDKDGSVKYYLPKGKCMGFEKGKKYAVEEWIKLQDMDDDLVIEWNSFLNKLKDSNLPLDDKFFILFFKKIFYDFDNDFVKTMEMGKNDLRARMKNLYGLANEYLFQTESLKKGYGEFMTDKDFRKTYK